jgi:hypothetical protein
LPPDNLVGYLTPGPLANRTPGITGRFARQRHYLADLFGRDPSRSSRTRNIGETVFEAQVIQGHGL